MKIKRLSAREILDSRGMPTLETCVHLEDGKSFKASVPSGASTGSHEARELRDGGERYEGKGVLHAVQLIETRLSSLLVGREIDPQEVDAALLSEGGPLFEKIGSNTALSLSMAVVRAAAATNNQELFAFIGTLAGNKNFFIPRCLYNIVNGGMHARNGVVVQEFLVRPEIQKSYASSLEQAVSIYSHLKRIFEGEGLFAAVGDEGGFAPFIPDTSALVAEEKIFTLINEAIAAAGLTKSVDLCIDAAASTFYDKENNRYSWKSEKLTSLELIALYTQWRTKYGLASIEDGCAEDDVEGWQKLYSNLGSNTQIVGDDFCVTESARIQDAVKKNCINAVIIKPNQIGTVTGALQAASTAKALDVSRIVSHRSGETDDTFIADFAVGIGAEQFKAGAPAREERVVKYNRLLEIEALLTK